MKVINTLILFFLIFALRSFSQEQKPYGHFSNTATESAKRKMLKAARKEMDYGYYDVASEKYAALLKLDSINPTYNFEQAQVLYSNFRQPESIQYFERAIKYSKDSLREAYYLLATAYHLSGKFDKAQDNYKIYLSFLNSHEEDLTKNEEKDMKNEIKHKIKMCDNGKEFYRSLPADKFTINGKTHSFKIENIGNAINSDYDDYGAVLSSTDSVIYFTSRRGEGKNDKLDWDDKKFEDIYKSNFGKNGWEKCTPIGRPINTKKHEAVINISPDGKTLYFYRGINQGTFYYSSMVGTVWSKPKILFRDKNVNTSSWETSFFGSSATATEQYFVSDRDGGIGARDIYVSKKQPDGTWSPLQNIGPVINTEYDEDAPFITQDGKTMYFSSKGHNSMGGFDIFKSERQGTSWSEPVNLGIPFNTPGEDIYFIIANNSNRAFYSSSGQAADGTQDVDIYTIDLCDDIPETILAGIAFGISYATVSVTEKATGQKIADFKIENGKYSIRLKHGADYRFTLNYPSIIDPVSVDISIPKLCNVYDLYQELVFQEPGQPIVFKNAFFDMKKETLKAGTGNYTEFLNKLDKKMLLYSEISVPTAVFLAKADGKPLPTASVTVSTTAAGTHTVTATAVSTATTTDAASATSTSATTVSTATTTASTTTTSATTATVTAAGSPGTTIPVNNVLFDYDKSTLSPEFVAELDKAVDFLKKNKNAKIEVDGYTDSKGTDEYNLALSKRRANAVAAYLSSKGIGRNRIKTEGHGESKPIAGNENPDGSDNPEGRAKNRRTEITLINS